ncbi:hypothetical protein [Ferribacterium limneticum]|uniref:hypothetical protein n=1 Tax=Ferribacterium limneticum TaxID=76259 RepID=UPI001CFACB16|nr:hypothetical protein [Ferribacterium limneticum]UCV30296.1 hypothetical protein KI617_09580 [Ferribacterium limneticum]UCV34215.1 hypothetical protein KI608_09580 [Ferribacterium limneticum]
MQPPLIPQEVYLLERYSSLEYFGQMRDAFEACVKAAEHALAEFMKHLPPDYRNQPLWKQPDAVWGETVIPNLQYSLRGVFNGYIRLSHGDYEGLALAGNVNTSFAGVIRDYDSEWMPEPFMAEFDTNMSIAWELASNISRTQQGDWLRDTLASRYREDSRGPLDAPPSWPVYRLNHAVRVKTGDKVPQNGVYLPDAPGSCAEFLIEGYETWEANVMDHPENPEDRSSTSQATVWTLIERVADTGGGTGCGPQESTGGETRRSNVPAGTHCPESGWWFTPAQSGSRRYFKAGENIPSVGGDYGLTFWQWSPDQSALSL